MAHCILCTTKLGFTNKPTFGQGKLADGAEICFPCFNKIIKQHPGTSFKTMTSEQVAALSNSSAQALSNENIRLEEIKKQVAALGVSSFFGSKEINHLPKVLFDTEEILDIVQGVYNKAMGVLVATNLRILFLDKGWFSAKVEDFPYDKISSINYETGLFQGKITLTVSGNRSEIENVRKDRVKAFADSVRAKLSNLHEQSKQPQQVIVNQAVDVAGQLEKLAALKEKGLLTDEEFSQQKMKLLSL